MNQFYNQMFNPTYVNPGFYQSIPAQAMWQDQQDQNAEVQKAVKATRDLCEAVNKLDVQHQQQAFLCLLGDNCGRIGMDKKIVDIKVLRTEQKR